jgi:propanol-preferring alcohol dehydrogenase
VNCRNQEYTGIHHDGEYAEVMIAKPSGLVSIPDDLSSVDAAPLLCAGLTTFSALMAIRRPASTRWRFT